MERRRAERIKQRLTCELIIGDRRHPGIVLDISETGLFIQTSASPPPGERARLTLRRPDGTEVELEASVARRYVIPRRLVSVARGGIGLRIESASKEFIQLVDSVTRKGKPDLEAANPSSSPCSQGGAYRVRVKQTSGPRSRTLRIRAASEAEAKVAASAELEEGWEILAVEPVAA